MTDIQEIPMNETVTSTTNSDGRDDDPLADEPELRKELATLFLVDCPKLLSAIREAITQRNKPALTLAAHTLKGSAGIFHVTTAFQAAAHMEHIGRNENWGAAEEAWNSLVLEMTSLSVTLHTFTNYQSS